MPAPRWASPAGGCLDRAGVHVPEAPRRACTRVDGKDAILRAAQERFQEVLCTEHRELVRDDRWEGRPLAGLLPELRHPDPQRAVRSCFVTVYATLARAMALGVAAEAAEAAEAAGSDSGDLSDLIEDLGGMALSFLRCEAPAGN
ncbi:hypothetical protein [Streptomyces sp. NPDC090994]|uniref:hypothetical protein n=1 Tax=Streptomyces sp. NPDC090994 TaxID=3365969 RepID=UPI00382A917A